MQADGAAPDPWTGVVAVLASEAARLMPADYRIDPTRRLTRTRLSGRLTDDELAAMEARLRTDPQYVAAYDHLIDASGVTELGVTAAGVHHIVAVTPNGTGCAGRRVIVAPGEALYGMARMFQMMREAEPPELVVVRSLAEAESLLARPAAADVGRGLPEPAWAEPPLV